MDVRSSPYLGVRVLLPNDKQMFIAAIPLNTRCSLKDCINAILVISEQEGGKPYFL